MDRVVKAASLVYALYQKEDQITVDHPDSEHDFPDAQRQKAYALIEKVLNPFSVARLRRMNASGFASRHEGL